MIEYDLSLSSLRELNTALHALTPDSNKSAWQVHNPRGAHAIAVGMTEPVTVEIMGHVGFYCAGMNQRAEVIVHGHAGPGVAENMMSGRVTVKGNASQGAGASAHGGLLIIEGDASSRCGISMKGIDIVVKGSVGHMSGFMAQSGRLVVCGDAGDALGDSLYEAQIYVAGDVHSLGADCVAKPIDDEHTLGLRELLARASVDTPVSRFRRYGCARELYHFKVSNLDAY